jgi:hypothetical protein
MGFFGDLDFKSRHKAVPRLNAVVDATTINLRKQIRDFPKWNNTSKAEEIISALPFRIRKELGADAKRTPYLGHAAYAAIQSPYLDESEILTRLRIEFVAGKHSTMVELADPRVRYLCEKYGKADAHGTVRWIAAEQEARHATYGTNGIYWREYFGDRLRHFRKVLECEVTPPANWCWILTDIIESGLLKASYRHHAHGKIYPSFGLIFDLDTPDVEWTAAGGANKGSRKVYKPRSL